ncbi:hypothetical protein OOT55_16335 [Marinimicrobium sp. C6131]|uniref:hypothetical protein n=1 Tax=Marinimicrobium sp. C6131 TaxID=3022676 RepID=UPI00223CF219|nr:hypothetical protein [Marinimicrobium sp. C6131]UZJ44209.1 hypothetical protein OOT55_16335 [Marinimicrobium sp. C6131]
MSHLIDFKPKGHLKASAQLDAFIAWAQATLPKGIPSKRVHAGIRWDMSSWHSWGLRGCTFTAYGLTGSTRAKDKKYMQPPFVDFAKALIVYYGVFHGKKSAESWLQALRILEVALIEVSGAGDVTKVSAAICNRACEHLQANYPDGNIAYCRSRSLTKIVQLMREKGLLEKRFRWSSPLKWKRSGTLKEQKKNRERKLPSRDSLLALGELFNSDLTSPLDIITTSACALLLSQPSRIGELSDVERDCVVLKDDAHGNQRMFLRWHAEKGFGATTKPVVKGMEPSVERVIKLMTPITDEARTYAAWLEDHPDEFPPHEHVPRKGLDDPLTYDEACAALKTQVNGGKSPRMAFKIRWLDYWVKREAVSPSAQAVLDEIQEGWDVSQGKRICENGSLKHRLFNDRAVITLRKLNILMREKYLPKDFPYTTPAEDGKSRVKYRDALFTVRTGSLLDDTKIAVAKSLDFGVEIAASSCRIRGQLGGSQRWQSIFERHGYRGLKVNTHAFRHELNTEMHRAGLSQLLIDAFSGRTTMGSVYNHVTVEERTQAVAAVHPKTKQSNAAQRLEKIRTNDPLSLSDVTDLAEGSQDRVIHKTHLGICVHSFESEPCPKMGACLTCGNLGCVKGDDVKLANLKEERIYLKQRYDKAVSAEARKTFGASEWRKKSGLDLLKCDALIKTLENPEVKNGDIVWNSDNGWNLTNNAAAMAGLIDAKIVEAPRQAALPSLDELSAMLDEIEV